MGILKRLLGRDESDIVTLSKMAMDRGNVDFEVVEGSDGSVSFNVTGRAPTTSANGKKQKQPQNQQPLQQNYNQPPNNRGRNPGRPHGRPN